MDQPLGRAVGNSIEVNETLDCLAGGGPPEVNELTIRLSAQALVDVGRFESTGQAITALRRSINSGEARERFDRMIATQGGKIDGPLPLAPGHVCPAPTDGHVESIDCETLGRCVVEMGGGRRRVEDPIDPRVGLAVHVRIGDRVEKGQPLITIHTTGDEAALIDQLRRSIRLSDTPVAARPLVIDTVDARLSEEPS
jgi:thymidine phosphorylase